MTVLRERGEEADKDSSTSMEGRVKKILNWRASIIHFETICFELAYFH